MRNDDEWWSVELLGWPGALCTLDLLEQIGFKLYEVKYSRTVFRSETRTSGTLVVTQLIGFSERRCAARP